YIASYIIDGIRSSTFKNLGNGLAPGHPGTEIVPAGVVAAEQKPGTAQAGIHLPVAAQFAASSLVLLKGQHISGGIPQKQADLMGKVLVFGQPGLEEKQFF